MHRSKLMILMGLVLISPVLRVDQGWGQGNPPAPGQAKKVSKGLDAVLKARGKVTQAARQAAAENFKAAVGAAAVPEPIMAPGGTPHYFGPYGNWAYSPLPRGSITAFTIDAAGAGYNHPLVTIEDFYGTGSGATAT